MNFINKKVSVQQVIETLTHQGVHVDNDEAAIILDFLYLLSKNHKEIYEDKNPRTLTVVRISEGMR